MTAPSSTIWPLEAHTRAKHEILRRYLKAWHAILTLGGFRDIVYIDGFAGPGLYSGGEDGSPIIALKNAHTLHLHRRNIPRLFFLFIEKDEERARTLDLLVERLQTAHTGQAGRVRAKVAGGQTFEEAFFEFLSFYESRGRKLPPTFAFIDPFGWKGVPFGVVQKIMGYPHCEVLVNFMYEEVNRFIGHPDQENNFDSFFGTKSWREALAIQNPRARNRFLHDLYAKQLSDAARVKFVRSFQMKNDKDVTDYFLFHGTNSLKGLMKMKEAMWKVDESGEFTFSDATDPDQLVLIEKAPRFELLRRQIVDAFRGQETTVGAVEEFVVSRTAFRETHYKPILRLLENADPSSLVVTRAPEGRRRGTFGDPGIRIRFK